MLRGIDVSAHQGEIAWIKVAGAGFSFAFMKAAEGATIGDPFFASNWSGALYAGLARGAYHFLTAGPSAEEQARAFLRIYPGGGELPPVLDVERGLDGSDPSPEAALVWIDRVKQETGVMPMIYCSPSFADTHGFARHAFNMCDLWIAHWDPPYGPSLAAPRVPRPWKDWRVWQRRTELVTGIHGPVDVNEMRAWT